MLTDLKVRNAKPELKGYKLYDQGGLFLLVSPTGIRHWRFRYQFQKKSRELSLGQYPAIGLASARLAHLSLRGQIAHGIDPLLERQRLELVSSSEKKVREETFGKAVIRYLRSKEHGWSETHRRDVNRIFEKELLPQIGPKQISEISKRDIKAVIDRIVARDALTYVRDVVAYYGAVIRHYNSYSDVEEIGRAHV